MIKISTNRNTNPATPLNFLQPLTLYHNSSYALFFTVASTADWLLRMSRLLNLWFDLVIDITRSRDDQWIILTLPRATAVPNCYFLARLFGVFWLIYTRLQTMMIDDDHTLLCLAFPMCEYRPIGLNKKTNHDACWSNEFWDLNQLTDRARRRPILISRADCLNAIQFKLDFKLDKLRLYSTRKVGAEWAELTAFQPCLFVLRQPTAAAIKCVQTIDHNIPSSHSFAIGPTKGPRSVDLSFEGHVARGSWWGSNPRRRRFHSA